MHPASFDNMWHAVNWASVHDDSKRIAYHLKENETYRNARLEIKTMLPYRLVLYTKDGVIDLALLSAPHEAYYYCDKNKHLLGDGIFVLFEDGVAVDKWWYGEEPELELPNNIEREIMEARDE